MKLTAHSSYQRVNTAFADQVPSHWRATALKFLGEYLNGYPFKPEDWSEDGLPIIRISQLTGGAEPNCFLGELDDRFRVSRGDLLFSWSASIDAYIWEGGDAWLNQHIFKVRPSPEATKRYLYYLIKQVAPKLAEFDAHGSTMRHIKKESLGERVFVPDPTEQAAVASFLDRETARIDALIEKKTRFIDLLREKRQALITQGVTRGFTPSNQMRDSGLAELGEIPSHWSITKIKRMIKSIGQGWSPECEARPPEDDEWGVLKVGCVNGGFFRPSESKALPATLEPRPELVVSRGDVLVSRANTRELVGSCAVITEDHPKLMLCDKLYRLVAADEVDPEFLAHVIAVHCRRQVEIEANGASSSMVNIAQEVILDVQVPRPPLAEQVAIVQDTRLRGAKLDRLIGVTAKSVELMSERRAALITAAVTGQINVRAEAAEDATKPA